MIFLIGTKCKIRFMYINSIAKEKNRVKNGREKVLLSRGGGDYFPKFSKSFCLAKKQITLFIVKSTLHFQ